MAGFTHSVAGTHWRFDDLRDLLAKASPARSGDSLAGIAASSDAERVAAQMCLAQVPLKRFLNEALIPYEDDEVTRLIKTSYERSRGVLLENLDILHKLADILLEKETIMGKELDEVILSMRPGIELLSKKIEADEEPPPAQQEPPAQEDPKPGLVS